MRSMRVVSVLAASGLGGLAMFGGGCSTSGCACNPCLCSGGDRVVAAASAEQKSALLDRVKSLAGTWEMADDKGVKHDAAVFTVTSAGNVVREIMFPGSDHEMTNMYHQDGGSLIVTHYCAVGNQPRMRAQVPAAGSDRIAFTFDSVTNKTSDTQTCMGNMTLIFVDADTIRQEWRSTQGPKEDSHAVFTLTRKQ